MKTQHGFSKMALGISMMFFWNMNSFAAEGPPEPFGKYWYVGLGPVVSNALVGTNGTK